MTDWLERRAVIRTPEGADIWSARQLKAHSGVVVMSLPANVFSNGDYIVRLAAPSGEAETVSAGSYYFRVEKR